jgi:hypothetical protein
MNPDFPMLDPSEEHFRIPGPHPGLKLFVRFLPASGPRRGTVLLDAGQFFMFMAPLSRRHCRSRTDLTEFPGAMF